MRFAGKVALSEETGNSHESYNFEHELNDSLET
jgi:hypothetical protein